MAILKDKDSRIQYAFYDELIFRAYPEYINLTFEEIHRKLGNVGQDILLEKAIEKEGNLIRFNTVGMDFVDGSDAKTSSVRLSCAGKSYSAPISKIHKKRGLLRCMVFERHTEKFYYFLIPYSAYKDVPEKSNIDIYFNLDGTPRQDVKPNKYIDFWAYVVPSFGHILAATAPIPWTYTSDVWKSTSALNIPLQEQHLLL